MKLSEHCVWSGRWDRHEIVQEARIRLPENYNPDTTVPDARTSSRNNIAKYIIIEY